MAKIDDFLQGSLNIGTLLSELGLASERHVQLPLLLLSWQGRTKEHEVLAWECRGVIIDPEHRTLVARGLPRSFDIEDGTADAQMAREAFDWASARSRELYDGISCQLWFKNGAWRASTANGFGEGKGGTAAWWQEAQSLIEPQNLAQLDRTVCWHFTLLGPDFAMVKRWDKNSLVLTGAVRTMSGECLTRRELVAAGKLLGVPVTEETKVVSPRGAKMRLSHLVQRDPLLPGVLLTDAAGVRLKLHNPVHQDLSRRFPGSGSSCDKFALRLIMQGKASEYLALFPEAAAVFDRVSARFASFEADLLALWERVRDAENEFELVCRLVGAGAASELVVAAWRRFGARGGVDELHRLCRERLDLIAEKFLE